MGIQGTRGAAIAMIAVIDKTPISFSEFIAWYPEVSEIRYELRRGVIVEMPKPKGKHSEIAGFVIKKLNNAIDQMQVPCFIPRECIIKIADDTGYEPDVAVIVRPLLANEPHWENSSVIEHGKTVKLVVEVVSTNWRDDYALKMSDYESIGIDEYWIVDYLGIGGRRYIGSPKQPTFTVCTLMDGEYEMQQFRGKDRIISPAFPDLSLTVNQIFNPGE
jgi:Uma2 family endonuclease